MKKLLCLLLTIILISLTGCGSSNVDNNTDILVNEAGSEEKNASEMQEPMENTGEEVTESKESVPETKYISIDLLEAEEIHADIFEELKETVDFTEEWVESLESSIMNDNLSQAEMSEKSQLMYEFWDGQLNKAWRILKENLDADTMKVLTQEQLDWIAMKEASMKEAGAEVEGGSMYGMVVNQRGAELTKERVYELMEIVDDCIK